MSLKTKIIIGLADEEVGSRVADVVENIAGGPSSLGFFGAAATVKPTGITVNNATAIAGALANLGLIATTNA